MSEWRIVKLGEAIEIYDHKRVPLSSTERQGRQGIYPYYGASGVIDHIDNYIFDGRYILIAEDGENLNSRKLPVAFFATGQFWVNNHAHIIRAKAGIADDYFIVGWFAQADISGYITGTAQPKLSQANLKQIEIPLPPLETQRRIAEILSAYDDLIENNAQRIKSLEQAAHDLYREWFVEFRFPGHESVKLVDSGTAYGMIPQGWEVVTVDKILEYHIGGGWGKDEPDKKHTLPAYVIRGTDIPEARYVNIDNCPLRFHSESNLKTRVLKAGDIVFEVSGGSKGQPVGRALWISDHLLRTLSEDVICASFCKLLRTNQAISSLIFYLYLLDIYQSGEIEKYQVQSTGIINFKFSHFLESALVLIAVDDVQTAFSEFAQPLFDEIQVLGKRNNALREARDLLLSRLVSGQLDVSEIEEE